jgi:GxxExxY protein
LKKAETGSPQRRKGRKGKRKGGEMDLEAQKTETREDLLSNEIIGAAIEVHRHLGPGLLESAYEECICQELGERGVRFERQKSLPVTYKGTNLDCGYRLDLVVDGLVILELKAVDRLEPIHTAQLLTYLKLSELKLGLLVNFNVQFLRTGVKRIVNNL